MKLIILILSLTFTTLLTASELTPDEICAPQKEAIQKEAIDACVAKFDENFLGLLKYIYNKNNLSRIKKLVVMSRPIRGNEFYESDYTVEAGVDSIKIRLYQTDICQSLEKFSASAYAKTDSIGRILEKGATCISSIYERAVSFNALNAETGVSFIDGAFQFYSVAKKNIQH